MNQSITIASTTTTDRLDKVYILLNSIKQNKKQDTGILYYLFVQFTSEYDENYCEEYFKPLYSNDFMVVFTDLDIFEKEVNTRERKQLYYAKCLFPSHFSDRILFLDVDMVFVNKGIEELWNTDLDDYYVGACIDPTWQFCPEYRDKENTGTTTYFNAGMLLFNITKIREDKKDKELSKWCLNWNYNELKYICYDQTLLNYVLKDKVKILDFKYNNSLLATQGIAQKAYLKYLKDSGYSQPFNSIYSAVILHFCGANKPWGKYLIKNEIDYPYKKEAMELWATITYQYGRKNL